MEPIKDTLSCVARAKVTLSAGGWGRVGVVHALTVNNNDPLRLRGTPLLLRVRMQYEIVRVDETGELPWRCTTHGYDYEVQLSSGEAVVSYHWHPASKTKMPHLHIGRTQLASGAVLSHKVHVPTDRVSVESVVRSCITEYGVEPMHDDWDEILTLREGAFKLYRSWGTYPPPYQ